MDKVLIFICLFSLSPTSIASEPYINSNRVVLALEAIYGIGAGVGGKDCRLCHTSSAGGPGNINNSFGRDFRNTAFDILGVAGNGLPATGTGNTLETIFRDTDLQDLDSDGDTVSNGDEFQANTDPADNVSGSTSGGGGGGCGIIKPPQGGSWPPTGLAILLLPFLLLFSLRHKKSEP